mgnify:CR=1 FL=1
MRVSMDVNFKKFHKKCEATISKVANSSLVATQEACEDILEESLNQVPRDTNTLANSAYYEITRSASYGFEADIGYGNGLVNPKSGAVVEDYAVVVHEDLEAHHPIGKAKFLEDPVRQYADEHFPRTIIKNVGPVLDGENNE